MSTQPTANPTAATTTTTQQQQQPTHQSNIPATNTEPHSGISPNISEGDLDQEEYFDYALDQQPTSATVTPVTPSGESQKLKINARSKYEFKPHEITPTEFHRSESEVFRGLFIDFSTMHDFFFKFFFVEDMLFSSVDEQ